jgi:lactate racemase
MTTYSLKYGRDSIPFEVPRTWSVTTLKHREPEPLSLREALLDALMSPTDKESFSDWLANFRDVLLIVPDITRYAGMERVLPILYREFLEDVQTRIIFALGNHRKQTEAEKRAILSEAVHSRIPSWDHDCFDASTLDSVGQTASGLNVQVNRSLLRADAAIVTGSINFHYLAGFGGGRKAILPGIAGYETILGIHKKVFRNDGPGKHTMAKSGILEGNPMHAEIMEGIGQIKVPLFLINTVLTDKKDFLKIVAGDIRSAHREGCNWFRDSFSASITEKADIVIVGCGGFPKDINFIQAHKTIEHAFEAVKEAGTMIVAGKCEDGFGHADFLRWFDHGPSSRMEPHVRASDRVYSQTAYATRYKAERCNVLLVSGLDKANVHTMGCTPHQSLKDAIRAADDGREKVCYIIPDGSNTLIVQNGQPGARA